MNIFSHIMNIDKDSSIYVASADGNLYSIYKHNGEIRWQVSYEGGFHASSPSFSPDGETIYIAGHDSNFYALNLDKSLKWKFSCGPTSIIPAVDNEGNLYIIAKLDSTGLHSIYPNGSMRWSYNFANWNPIGPLMLSATMDRNGNIYFHAPSHSNNPARIISLDYFGNFRWEYVFEEPDEWIVQPLICDAEGTVYCGSTWGYYYYAISSEGELLWKLPLNGYQVDNSGTIGSDGTLYIGTHLGSLVTGQEKTLIAIRDTVTSVEVSKNELLNFKLEQNYPNPFNSTTHIRYTIPRSGRVSLKVYDILGKEVATLLNRFQQTGEYDVLFQPENLPTGIYFYILRSGNFADTKKLILLR
jgi:outer membrane protein assembly factor BamB